MKQIIIISWLIGCMAAAQAQNSNFYKLQLTDIAGNKISMASYAGQKVLVALCSASSPNIRWLSSLDSLQRKEQNALKVIIIPAQDFDAVQNIVDFQHLFIDSLRLNLIFTQPAYSKKSAGSSQHTVLKWATNAGANGNTHFEHDVISLKQTFVISERGRLFAVTQGDNDFYLYVKSILTAQVPDN